MASNRVDHKRLRGPAAIARRSLFGENAAALPTAAGV
jgi:hypothetical protein